MMKPTFCVVCIAVVFSCARAGAQVAPANSKEEPPLQSAVEPGASVDDDLLDGLLELVPDEPKRKTLQSDVPDDLKPQDVGLTLEELGAGEGPLVPIKQSMLISAGLMRRGDAEVARLQSDILFRLDELIGQIESGQTTSAQQQDQAESRQEGETQSRQMQSTREQDVQASDLKSDKRSRDATESGDPNTEDSDLPPSDTQASGNPSDSGPRGATRVEMNAPQAYQQKVWGLLPERVRASMQSGMVEQFLPSHREQIEVYYQRLLERYREND